MIRSFTRSALAAALIVSAPTLAQTAAPATPAAPASAPAPVPAANFTSDRIAVTVTGSGPDVVLIPGLSSSPKVWEQMRAAVPGYRYHLVQVKGFAGVAPEANASGPVLLPVAGEIARYIEAARLDRPALIGHSMGGSLAMSVATSHPDRVGKLMVVDMVPFLGMLFGGPTATPDSVRPMAEMMRTRMTSGSAEESRPILTQMISGMIRNEAMRPVGIADSLASDRATVAQSYYDLATTDLTPALARFTGPMKVLWVVPAGAPVNQEMMGMLYRSAYAPARQATLTYIPDSAHFIMWDQPTRFAQEVTDFLK